MSKLFLALFGVLLSLNIAFGQSVPGTGGGGTGGGTGCNTTGASVLKGDGVGGCANAVSGTDIVVPGAITTSGFTQATARLLGRTTAGTGAPEELTVSGCTLSGGALTCTTGTVTSVGLVGTANQITVTGSSPITGSGSWTLSIPTNPTLPGTTTGTFSGNLTGNVTGNVTGNASGTAATITGLLTSANIAKADIMDTGRSCSDAGASDAYACNLSPAITAYVTGTYYRFKANTANTGAATINFNSLGAITIVRYAGGVAQQLSDNDIRAGQWVDIVYDGTNMQMQSTLGNAGAGSGDITTVGNCVTGDCFSAAGVGTALTLRNATSGTVTLQTVTGALGSAVLSAPAVTGTLLTGTGAVNQVCVYTGTNACSGSSSLTWDGTNLGLGSGNQITITGTITAPRTVTVPDAPSVTVQPNSGTANQFVTGISSVGVVATAQPSFSNISGTITDAQVPNLNTLSTGLTTGRCVETDGSGFLTVAASTCGTGGSGDNITVNGGGVSDANFNDTTPAAPGGSANVVWNSVAGPPHSISASIGLGALGPALINNLSLWDGSQASRTLTANLSGTDPVITFSSNTVNVSTGNLQQGGTNVALVSGTQTLTGKTLTNPALTHQTLTDGATINWDMSSGNMASVTLGGNRTMAAPTNLPAAGTVALRIIQDGTGSRTITWNSVFKWPSATAPTLSTTAGRTDLVTCAMFDGTNLLCNATLDVR